MQETYQNNEQAQPMTPEEQEQATKREAGREKVYNVKWNEAIYSENGRAMDIVIDTETTGLDDTAELLQVSIISGTGRTLFNSYIKPYGATEWKEAEQINHISPDMVAGAPYLHEVAERIILFLMSARRIIGYNIEFDLRKLEQNGIRFEYIKYSDTVDVMKDFAPIYGEWNEEKQDYKWQKLTTACKYYGYDFKAHDSLEDVKATLFVYNKIREGEK